MTVQLCPKCMGQGVVTRPPGVPADAQSWVASTIGPYRCDLCKGRTVLGIECTCPTCQPVREMTPEELAECDALVIDE